MCICECGVEKEVNAQGLKNGSIRSCGCLARERRSKLGGFSKHPLYALWDGIIGRCTNPKDVSYYNYGGRGITVCERWLDPWAFAEDIERKIGPRPEGVSASGRALYSLDRIDNDGGYWCGHCAECMSQGRPLNVQWSTTSEQCNQSAQGGQDDCPDGGSHPGAGHSRRKSGRAGDAAG